MTFSRDHFRRAIQDDLLTGEKFVVDVKREFEIVSYALDISGLDDTTPVQAAVVIAATSAQASRDRAGPGRFAASLTRAYLDDLGYDFADRGRALASYLDAINGDGLRSQRTFTRIGQIIETTLMGRFDDPRVLPSGGIALELRVFIAEPVTDECTPHPSVLVARKSTSQLMSNFGVSCHCARDYADPAFGRDVSDDPSWRARDATTIATSDVALILHPYASTGLGVVVEMAKYHGVPVVVADFGGPLSPMVSGLNDIVRITLGPDTASQFLGYILAQGPRLDSLHARRTCSEFEQWDREREAMARRFEELLDQGASRYEPVRLTRERLHELLSSSAAWASATRAEMAELEWLAAGPALPELTQNQRLAFEQAVSNNKWDSATQERVELEGRRVLAMMRPTAEGAHRWSSQASSPRFWEDIERGL